MRALPMRQLFSLFNLFAVSVLLFAAEPVVANGASENLTQEIVSAQNKEAQLRTRHGTLTQDDFTEISALYRGIVNRHPKNAEAQNIYGEFLWSMGQKSEAFARWKAAEKLAPENAAVIDNLGGAFLAQGEITEAHNAFQRAVKIDPKNALYHFNLANLLYTFRQYFVANRDENSVLVAALEHYRLAAELAPQNPVFAQGYAETFYGIPHPDWNAAHAAWLSFLKITAKKNYVRLNLARVSLKMNKPHEATAWLAQIHDPSFAPVKDKLLRKAGQQSSAH